MTRDAAWESVEQYLHQTYSSLGGGTYPGLILIHIGQFSPWLGAVRLQPLHPCVLAAPILLLTACNGRSLALGSEIVKWHFVFAGLLEALLLGGRGKLEA